jgi:hypothetical protein
MDFTPDPIQTLLLWRLLADDGGAFQNGLKPNLAKPKRDPLVKAGLLEIVKRKKTEKARAANFLQLTDAGWEWCAANLDAEVSKTSTASGPILQSLLTKLKRHLESQHVSLADFIRPPEVATSDTPDSEDLTTDEATPESGPVRQNGTAFTTERLRGVCSQLAHGARGARIYLADIRRVLSDVNRESVDGALRELERDRAIVLYPLDNPQEIKPEDSDAALANSAGFARHIVYLP